MHFKLQVKKLKKTVLGNWDTMYYDTNNTFMMLLSVFHLNVCMMELLQGGLGL